VSASGFQVMTPSSSAQPGAGRHRHPVRDDHDQRLSDAGHRILLMVGALVEFRAEQVEQGVMAGGNEPQRPRRVLLTRMGVVRQPFHPIPVRQLPLARQHRDLQFVG
jgi:hypothetical protein